MNRPNLLAAGALTIAVFAGAAFASESSGDAHGRYALDVFENADGGGGAFVTDTATGETMFCTPRECFRLPIRPPAPTPAAEPPRVRRGIPEPPPDLALPPALPPASGSVNPLFENF